MDHKNKLNGCIKLMWKEVDTPTLAGAGHSNNKFVKEYWRKHQTSEVQKMPLSYKHWDLSKFN